ncbi:hypothetical protein ABI59_06025 [Acidobacteria bacterium Mor1]|nr:hypothetical protein ABI59_06025 [Acidobacteria bacterium Mor1]
MISRILVATSMLFCLSAVQAAVRVEISLDPSFVPELGETAQVVILDKKLRELRRVDTSVTEPGRLSGLVEEDLKKASLVLAYLPGKAGAVGAAAWPWPDEPQRVDLIVALRCEADCISLRSKGAGWITTWLAAQRGARSVLKAMEAPIEPSGPRDPFRSLSENEMRKMAKGDRLPVAGEGGVTEPVVLADTLVLPALPEGIHARDLLGPVYVTVVAGADGTIYVKGVKTSFLGGLPHEQELRDRLEALYNAFGDVARNWKCSPPLLDGEPMDAYWLLEFSFEGQ